MAREPHYSRFVRTMQEAPALVRGFLQAWPAVLRLAPLFVRTQREVLALYPTYALDDLLRRLSEVRSKDATQAAVAPSQRRLSINNLAKSVMVLERCLPLSSGKNTCLFRSLVRFKLASQLTNEAVIFNLGLPSQGQGAGHAWVLVGGEIFPRHEHSVFLCTYQFVVQPRLDARIGP